MPVHEVIFHSFVSKFESGAQNAVQSQFVGRLYAVSRLRKLR